MKQLLKTKCIEYNNLKVHLPQIVLHTQDLNSLHIEK